MVASGTEERLVGTDAVEMNGRKEGGAGSAAREIEPPVGDDDSDAAGGVAFGGPILCRGYDSGIIKPNQYCNAAVEAREVSLLPLCCFCFPTVSNYTAAM